MNRHNWTALPMPNEVISGVEKMKRDARNGVWFTNRNIDPLLDLDNESDDNNDENYVDDGASTDGDDKQLLNNDTME